MSKKLKGGNIFISIIALVMISTIVGFNMYLNNEDRKWKEVEDKNLDERVENFFENFFMLENMYIDVNEFNEIVSSSRFINVDHGELMYIYSTKFLLNIKENEEKENIKFDVGLQKIFEDDENRLKVLFKYNRTFNIIGSDEVNKEETTYEAILLKKQDSLIIDNIYEADALKKDSFLDIFYSKEELYEKYIEDEFLKYKRLSRKYL
ncbi:TPA: hypothetical protein ACOTG0_001671 [Clostridium perfringens]